MKKHVIIFFILLLIITSYNFFKIQELKKEVKILNENNIKLIDVNSYLSERMSDMAKVLEQKSEFDKKVAAKIREFDSKINSIK